MIPEDKDPRRALPGEPGRAPSRRRNPARTALITLAVALVAYLAFAMPA